MRDTLLQTWDRLPSTFRSAARRSGLAYVGSLASRYRSFHRIDRFAGNLPRVHDEFRRACTVAQREGLARQFEEILDSVILPNGVRKTTYPLRQLGALTTFLAGPHRPSDGSPLRVLDLPSSSGVASVANLRLLEQAYTVESYVLADLCMELLVDPGGGCVYDLQGRLLQVRGRNQYFSIYHSHASGDAYSPLTAAILLPLTLHSQYLRLRHRATGKGDLARVSLVHPEVVPLVESGQFSLRSANVFDLDMEAEFDLVISFNLLQTNYFSPDLVKRGIHNLTRALNEGGYLLTGNTESFGIFQKRRGELVLLHKQGDW